MGFSEGALLLVEKGWIDAPAAADLKRGFADAARAAGLGLHDHDRGGEKGFRYGGPGFWTTPEGRAMRAHFEAAGDPGTAAKFHLSSMETAVLTGRDPETGRGPLCLVTELPLFVLGADYEPEPGVPRTLLAFQDALPGLAEAAEAGESLAPLVRPFGLRCLGLETAVRLQLAALSLGLAAVADGAASAAG